MTSIVFFSAKGAPGATTMAMLTASLWPRPVLLADCDPAGGDIGVRLPGDDGRPLDVSRGLLSLLPQARRALEPSAVLDHTQRILGGTDVLVGLSGPEQATAGGPVWAGVAAALNGLASHDIVVDAGRLDSGSPVLPLVNASRLAICVVDAGVSGVYAARSRLRALGPALIVTETSGPRVALIVRAGSQAEADAAAAVISADMPTIGYLGHLVEDAKGATIFDGGAVSRPERTLLVRSGAHLIRSILSALPVPGGQLQHSPVPADISGGPAKARVATGSRSSRPGWRRRDSVEEGQTT